MDSAHLARAYAADPASQPRVLSVHGPHPLSGVSTWIARLLTSDHTRYDWHALIVGSEQELAEMTPFPATGTGRVHTRAWSNDDNAATDHVNTVVEALDELRPSIVIPNYVPEAYAAAGLAAPRGVRTLGVCHSRDYWYLELFQHAAPLMHAAWAVSDECERLLHTTLGQTTNVLCAPYGTHLPEEISLPPHVIHPSEPIRILYTGRLETPQKRSMHLATIAEELHRRGVPFVLTIAGDGPDHEQLTTRLRPFIDAGKVSMLGAVPHAHVNSLIREHDLLILVSAYEGTPLAAIEAMALGRPIAVTDGCGGAADAVRAHGGGVVVPTDNPIDLTDHLERLSQYPAELQALASQAHDCAKQRFSLPVHIESIESLIDSALTKEVPQTPKFIVASWRAILATTSLAVGGWPRHVRRKTIRRWRTGFRNDLATIGHPPMSLMHRLFRRNTGQLALPARVPRIERLGATLLAAAANELSREGYQRIAIFPAGRHSTRHGFILARHPCIACFVDDAAKKSRSRTLHNHPILTPAGARSAGVDAIIISSDQYEESLESRAREWGEKVPVRTLYVPVRIPDATDASSEPRAKKPATSSVAN